MRRRALLQTVGAAAATALAGCGALTDGTFGQDSTPNDADDPSQTTTPPGSGTPLVVTNHDLVRQNAGTASELVAVEATVVNRGDAAVDSASLTATFLDGDGNSLDTSSADVAGLETGETWTVELTFPGAGPDARAVADYTIDVETGD